MCWEPQHLQWQLAGITSWGSSCTPHSAPGVYTDVRYFVNWAKTTMNQEFGWFKRKLVKISLLHDYEMDGRFSTFIEVEMRKFSEARNNDAVDQMKQKNSSSFIYNASWTYTMKYTLKQNRVMCFLGILHKYLNKCSIIKLATKSLSCS